MSLLGVQGIRTEDTATDPQRRQELRDDGEFILLLSRHLLLEQQARPGLIQAQLMHLALIGLLMAQRAAQGLAIQRHMHMLLAFCLSSQTAWFVSALLGRRHSGQGLHDHLIHLLGVHRAQHITIRCRTRKGLARDGQHRTQPTR